MNFKFLTLCCYLATFATIGYTQNQNDDWVFSYQFDGNARDEGKNQNHGNIKGTVVPVKNRFGEDGKALFFKGKEAGYISIPFNSTLNLPTDRFTFSIWVQLDQYHQTNYWETMKTDKYAPIFTKAEFEQTFQYRLVLTASGFEFDGYKDNYLYGTFYTKGPIVKMGKWHHIVVSFDNNFLNLYVDGTLISSEPGTNIFTKDNHPLVLGRDLPGALEYFHGAMDDFKFWSRTLTTQEIKSLFENEVKAEDKIEQPITENKETFDVEEGESIILHNVLFVQSKPELLPESTLELNKLVETLRKFADMEIEIAGHTDNQGERKKNVILSEQRALVVRDFLVAQGIAKSRIKCIGYGPDKPLNTNKTEEERRLNRRVEFKILKK